MTTWNPSDSSASLSFTNGNLTATYTAAGPSFQGVRGTTTRNSGKRYFEVTANTVGTDNGWTVGVANSTWTLTDFVGEDVNSLGYNAGDTVIYNGAIQATITVITSSNVISIAIDIGNGLIWFRNNGGNWNGSGTANPATGTGGVSTGTIGSTIFPAWNGFDHNDAVTANFGASAFSFAIPAGFNPWDITDSVTLNGTGSLSVSGSLAKTALAAFNGTGSLSVLASLHLTASAVFNGTGSLTANTIQHTSAISAVFNGTGSLSVLASLHLTASAVFNGTGSLSALGTLNNAAFATFNGTGQLSALAELGEVALVIFHGTGSLRVSTILAGLISAVFNGAGSLSVIMSGGVAVFAVFAGNGRLCCQAIRRLGPQGVFTNSVVQGPGPTNQKVVYGSKG